jgi:hypothetical protein
MMVNFNEQRRLELKLQKSKSTAIINLNYVCNAFSSLSRFYPDQKWNKFSNLMWV